MSLFVKFNLKRKNGTRFLKRGSRLLEESPIIDQNLDKKRKSKKRIKESNILEIGDRGKSEDRETITNIETSKPSQDGDGVEDEFIMDFDELASLEVVEQDNVSLLSKTLKEEFEKSGTVKEISEVEEIVTISVLIK
ncbi:uncharacterized protein LOC115230404 [Octopus sinensis]|uniref:Uncharacterized protein LOC115229213 n=1 Tax=Octopus sinensis TaxID=2607531 RepID=A0A6P7TZU3_9MOLL|nr:uncharacterized protein LOC115229213 [Octopus sinensis]XP_029656463.1 uncharacterized protein LOC115230404 [Octopus sinensis]